MEPRRPSLNPEPECAAQDAGYALTELTAQTLKAAFAGSPFAARIDSSDRCLVTVRNLEVAVVASLEVNTVLLWVLFTTRGRREEVLDFCHRFNRTMPPCKARLQDELHENGGNVVIISYWRISFEDERLSGPYVVRLVDLFARLVNEGMRETGPGDLVWDALVYLNADGPEGSPN